MGIVTVETSQIFPIVNLLNNFMVGFVANWKKEPREASIAAIERTELVLLSYQLIGHE